MQKSKPHQTPYPDQSSSMVHDGPSSLTVDSSHFSSGASLSLSSPRSYHSVKGSAYMMPIDEIEMDRCLAPTRSRVLAQFRSFDTWLIQSSILNPQSSIP